MKEIKPIPPLPRRLRWFAPWRWYGVALIVACVLVWSGIRENARIDAEILEDFRRGQETGAYPKYTFQPKSVRDFKGFGKSEFMDNNWSRLGQSEALRNRRVWIPVTVIMCLGCAYLVRRTFTWLMPSDCRDFMGKS